MNSAYWSNQILNTMYVNNQSVVFYIGLSSTMPNSDGSGVKEPGSGVGYSRVPIGAFRKLVDGSITNVSDITFPVSSGTWFPSSEKAKYYVIFDGAENSANVLSAGLLGAEMRIIENATIIIAAGVLRISIAGDIE